MRQEQRPVHLLNNAPPCSFASGTVERVDHQVWYEVSFEDGSICTNLPPSDVQVASSGAVGAIKFSPYILYRTYLQMSLKLALGCRSGGVTGSSTQRSS